MTFTVFAVDDNMSYLATVALVVGATPGAGLVGTATSGAAALGASELSEADLVLLDYRLPDMNGLDLAALLYERLRSDTVVLLMSSYASHELPAACLASPFVDGFVPKERFSSVTLQAKW